MPDSFIADLPPDETLSWLAKNRKIVILGGLAVLLGGAAVATALLPRKSITTTTSNVNSGGASTNSPTNSYDRPTFQRSTVPDVPTTLPPAYRPPAQSDLKNAIQQLNPTNQNH